MKRIISLIIIAAFMLPFSAGAQSVAEGNMSKETVEKYSKISKVSSISSFSCRNLTHPYKKIFVSNGF